MSLEAPKVNEIRITVAGKTNVGKTAVIESIAHILSSLGLVVVFDPLSVNMIDQNNQMLDPLDAQDRLAAIVSKGNLLVVLKETQEPPRDSAA
jgi:molybdopterin-guanine dinucleotide biosynthesis protein